MSFHNNPILDDIANHVVPVQFSATQHSRSIHYSAPFHCGPSQIRTVQSSAATQSNSQHVATFLGATSIHRAPRRQTSPLRLISLLGGTTRHFFSQRPNTRRHYTSVHNTTRRTSASLRCPRFQRFVNAFLQTFRSVVHFFICRDRGCGKEGGATPLKRIIGGAGY